MDGSGRSAELADAFDAAHREALALAEGCSDADWALVCPGEGWTVGVVLAHVADGYSSFDAWVRGYLEGRRISETRASIDAHNAESAAAAAAIPRDRTLTALRERAAQAAGTIRGLSDDQLAISHPLEMAGGRPVSAEQLVQVLLHHVSTHLGSCRQALDP